MIDVFLHTNTPITNVQAALAGFECNRVMVRNGGPTEVWKRTEEGWQKDRPGMTLYDDLVPNYVDFSAYRYERPGCFSDLVNGGMTLRLDNSEAKEWLSAMEKHRYDLEDAIGCSVNVEHAGKTIVCAATLFAVSDFKNLVVLDAPLSKKLLTWVDRILNAGADQVGVTVSIRTPSGE